MTETATLNRSAVCDRQQRTSKYESTRRLWLDDYRGYLFIATVWPVTCRRMQPAPLRGFEFFYLALGKISFQSEAMEVNSIDETDKKSHTRHNGKHDKDKPWDDPSTDRWKIEKFDPSLNGSGMLEVSLFSTLFPQYREKYLQECWPIVQGALKEHGIACELNLERFVKRRQHLVGPNSSTLKAVEILTGYYILVQGNSVAAMGSFKGLKQILMMKRELAKNPALANENWDRFLPTFKKKNIKQKKVKTKEKKPYTPFPPPQQSSKVDLQLESGEYFLSDKKKQTKKWQEKLERQAEKTAESKRKREEAFVPPEESINDPKEHINDKDDVAQMTLSLKANCTSLPRWRKMLHVCRDQ